MHGFFFRCSRHGVSIARTSGNAGVMRRNTGRYGIGMEWQHNDGQARLSTSTNNNGVGRVRDEREGALELRALDLLWPNP